MVGYWKNPSRGAGRRRSIPVGQPDHQDATTVTTPPGKGWAMGLPRPPAGAGLLRQHPVRAGNFSHPSLSKDGSLPRV